MIELNPNSENAYHQLSDVTMLRFQHRVSQGKTPHPVVKTYSGVIARLKKEKPEFGGLFLLQATREVLLSNLNPDPLSHLLQASMLIREGMKTHPENSQVLTLGFSIEERIARLKLAGGKDFTPHFERAEEYARKVYELNPANVDSALKMIAIRTAAAGYQDMPPVKLEEIFEESIEILNRLVGDNPNLVDVRVLRLRCATDWTRSRMNRADSFGKHLDLAAKDSKWLRETAPGSLQTRLYGAICRAQISIRVVSSAPHGEQEEAWTLFDKAMSEFTKLRMEENPFLPLPGVIRTQIEFRYFFAVYGRLAGKNLERALLPALEDLGRIMNGKQEFQVRIERARIYLTLATGAVNPNDPDEKADRLKRAIEDADLLIKNNFDPVNARALRGVATYYRALMDPEPSPELLKRAQKDLEEARKGGAIMSGQLIEEILRDIRNRVPE